MTKENLSKFEYLPNEILLDIFNYFDIQQLFQAFYNLNSRFNTLLNSLNDLSLTISRTNYNSFQLDEIPIHLISTLIITAEVHVDFTRFTHIRCLVMSSATFGQMQQVNSQKFPYLKHLSIEFSTQYFPYHLSRIISKLFSNGFPRLQSCCLPKMEAITLDHIWIPIYSLKKLIIGKIDLCVYKAILSSCPNLYFFKFIKAISKQILLSFSNPHMNLKKLIIITPLCYSGKQLDISIFLSYVPNLEQLKIHQEEFGSNLYQYLTYDWLSRSIEDYLPMLHRLNYYLEIYYFGLTITSDIDNNLREIEENFRKIHKKKYQSLLIVIQCF